MLSFQNLLQRNCALKNLEKTLTFIILFFFSKANSKSQKFSTRLLKTTINKGFIISNVADNFHSGLISKNQRLDFIYTLNWLINRGIIESEYNSIIHKNVKIHSTAIIKYNVSIGLNSIIGPNCNTQSGSVQEKMLLSDQMPLLVVMALGTRKIKMAVI